ncbi:hypothetical protein ES703_49389 [subsurface metagenome]
MPGESVPQGLWLPPRVATLLVAASDALDRTRAQADYICDGVADDVEINAALLALPAGIQGRVVLSEGTFNIVDSITIPASNITLRGQGRSTFIDGDGLATGEHGIVISGVTNVCVKKLSIQTDNGGDKTCHAIFVSDGANDFEIEYVTIVASDSDGIHIEGTNIVFGYIHDCHIEGADDYGIQVNPDAGNYMHRLHIVSCDITGTGISGIYFAGRCHYALIDENIAYLCGLEGISILTSHHSIINNNILYQNTLNGISITSSDHCSINNNICYNNTRHGILLNNSGECLLEGNLCTLNDRLDTNTYDGIHLTDTCNDNMLNGNHCCNNHNHGIACYGERNGLAGNFCRENDRHGIYVAAAYCNINGNYCYFNSQDGAGTYHGICLGGDADLCNVTGNFCNNPTAARTQESGIYLEDQCVMVNIIGNYCSWGLGSGIELADGNDNCQIKSNYCYDNDDYGIELLGPTAAPSKCIVAGNLLLGNGGALLDNGALTQVLDDNEGIDVIDIKVYRTVKNTSGVQRVAGDVVIIKGIATAIEFTTTAVQGDDKVYGMVAETIANNASGYVLVKGFTAALKVDGTIDIAIDDILGTFTTACIAMKAAAGDQGFALALEGYATDNSDGVIDAYIKSPWD